MCPVWTRDAERLCPHYALASWAVGTRVAAWRLPPPAPLAFRLLRAPTLTQAAAERVAGLTPNAITHPSVEALLSEAAVDAVVVATPHHVLCPVSLAAIRYGKHVLAEKPLASMSKKRPC